MGESNTSVLLCNGLLAADIVSVVTGAKSKMGFALAGMFLHAGQGILVIIDELVGESSLNDVRSFTTKVSRSIGMSLVATQICMNAFHAAWIPVVNIAIPATDLILYYVKEEGSLNQELVQISKLVSIGCIVYASMQNNDMLGYFSAAAYLLAELAERDEKEEGWCITTAIGDYLACLIVFGSLFGYSRGELVD